ncbi:MAG: RluA family pseudouridine synthase [Leptospiraceae bacterium]|nr:RluA family pseudouridine synthase [Leptospiraceae bacterium]
MLVVEPQGEALRLDLYLVRKYPYLSRTVWHKRIKEGHVYVNNVQAKASQRLRGGEIITFVFQQKEEPPTNKNFSIVYEDEEFLVIDKPPQLPVHPSGIYRSQTLYNLLKDKYENKKIHFVNRIDRETSGLVLVSLSARRLREILRLWPQVEKEYLVVVLGKFPEHYLAQGFIGPSMGQVRKKRVFVEREDPPGYLWQSAVTEFFLEGYEDGLSLVRCRLFTGRMHQIRATLCSLGYPVAGDSLYGVDERYYLRFVEQGLTQGDYQVLRGKRSLLHSYRLLLPSLMGESRQFVANIPSDFKEAMPRFFSNNSLMAQE